MSDVHEVSQRSTALIERLGIACADDIVSIKLLTGGVSSEIALVTLSDRKVCTKFALAKLKVDSDWFAPVHRNSAEYRWLEYAAALAPDNVPRLFGHSEALGGFAMEYLEGDNVRNWKAELLEGRLIESDVDAVARTLATLHAGCGDAVTDGFDNLADFEALRIEPYLLALKPVHPGLANLIDTIADGLRAASNAVIHGDVSPKNILFRGSDPIFLDAECATLGDSAFDAAFCLNHLLLKGLHLPAMRPAFILAARRFAEIYLALAEWEDRAALDARIARLLPLLMLARVDGKSPVEYLSETARRETRNLALDLSKRTLPLTSVLFDMLEEETV